MANTNDVHIADDQLCLALSKQTGHLITRSGRPIVATASQWHELVGMAGQLIPTDIPIFGMVWLDESRGPLDPWAALIKVVQAFTAGALVLSPEVEG